MTYWQFRGTSGGAAYVPKGTLKPTLTVDRVKLRADLAVIAETLLVDDVDLEDAPALRQSLDDEMAYDLLAKLDTELLLGTGTGGRWTGLLAGATGPTHAVAAGESPLDAISAAAARADQSGRYPDGIVLNGATFAACMAVKASTPDNYLVPPVTYPSPVFRGTTLRLAICGAMADGEALLGSFASNAKLDTANWLRFDVSNSMGDSFLKNQSWLRAESRAFLALTWPASSGARHRPGVRRGSLPGGAQPPVVPGA